MRSKLVDDRLALGGAQLARVAPAELDRQCTQDRLQA
jgi:hypothetical protein